MKKTLTIIFVFFAVFFIQDHNSYANSTTAPQIDGPTLESKLCEIRLVFCNKTAVAMISFALVFMALLIFMGKVHWTMVIIIVAGMLVFVQAHNVSESLSNDPDFQVEAACRCVETP